MDVCKSIIPLRHGVTLNSRRAASHFVKLVEGEMRREAPDHLRGVLPRNETNRTVTYMELKAKANDRRKSVALSRAKFRGPRSDSVRQVALVTTT
ncbi:uncharacterized protein TNCV_3449051 [Trichonephila clavipes]|nr:uncharacterized protein TNCV_3449051 [Trichonephila clavipes]